MNDLLPPNGQSPRAPDQGYHAYGPAPADDFGSAAASLRTRRFFILLRSHWWIPLVILILALGAAIGFILWKPPTYVSVARMWGIGKMSLPEGAYYTEDVQSFLGTQIELLQSSKLQQLALARLNASGPKAVPLDQDGLPLPVIVRVAPAKGSMVLLLEAKASDPAYTQAFLNALMDAFLNYKRDIRKTTSGDTLTSISEQANHLEAELKGEEDALAAFQRTNNFAIMQEQATMAGNYLAKLTAQLSDFRLESQFLEAAALDQDSLKSGSTNHTIAPGILARATNTTGSASEPLDVAASRKQVEVLKIQRQQLSRFLRPKHPKIVKLNEEIERGEKLMEMYRTQSLEQLAAARQAAQFKIASVTASIKEWEGKVVDATFRIAEADRIKANIQRLQSVHDRLLTLMRSVDMGRNIEQENMSILERASGTKRTYKEELLVLAAAVIGSFMAGLGLIYLLAARYDKFMTLEELRSSVPEIIIGQVPEIRLKKRKDKLDLLQFNDHRHMYAESFRNLRSAVHFMPLEGPRPKVILITSAVPDEGKSTIAVNLARTLSYGGAKVLLIDADLRKGHLHELLGLPRSPGLAEMLNGKGESPKSNVQGPESAIRNPQSPIPVEAAETSGFKSQVSSLPLDFIPSGCSSSPGHLFLTPAFTHAVARWRDQYDYVLIDTPPVFAAADVTTLAPKVDGVLFVVRGEFTRTGPLQEALDLLYQRQAKVLGLIFNRADPSARSYYYYKYSDYHSGNGKLKTES